jgi:hypothetical protein
MSEINILTVLKELSDEVILALQEVAGIDIASQLNRVIVPVQKIGGVPEDFSIMSFPYPRLTSKELENAPLVDEQTYILSLEGVVFRVDTDSFGQINWIYVKGAPIIYEALAMALSRVADTGDYKEFWKH